MSVIYKKNLFIIYPFIINKYVVDLYDLYNLAPRLTRSTTLPYVPSLAVRGLPVVGPRQALEVGFFETGTPVPVTPKRYRR